MSPNTIGLLLSIEVFRSTYPFSDQVTYCHHNMVLSLERDRVPVQNFRSVEHGEVVPNPLARFETKYLVVV